MRVDATSRVCHQGRERAQLIGNALGPQIINGDEYRFLRSRPASMGGDLPVWPCHRPQVARITWVRGSLDRRCAELICEVVVLGEICKCSTPNRIYCIDNRSGDQSLS